MKMRINGIPKKLEDICNKNRCSCETTETRVTHSKALLSLAKEVEAIKAVK